MSLEVTIDKNSGYCFGVEFAIQMAEDELDETGSLYCLGDIVHNAMEVDRLEKKGLKIISKEDLKNIKDAKVLIRAHGEPPSTYQLALENNVELIDASCPVVLKLQNRVKNAYDKTPQIVIYGKPGHAEVIGLTGQTSGDAIIVMFEEDLNQIDFKKPITLFSQTTKSTTGFYHMRDMIADRLRKENPDMDDADLPLFSPNDSICRQVSNREPQMEKFSQEHDVILFVSGKKSSNGKALHSVCERFNPKSYFIENESEIDHTWFEGSTTVGICGATSTPTWLMEKVADYVQHIPA